MASRYRELAETSDSDLSESDTDSEDEADPDADVEDAPDRDQDVDLNTTTDSEFVGCHRRDISVAMVAGPSKNSEHDVNFMKYWKVGSRRSKAFPFKNQHCVGICYYANLPENHKPIDFFSLFVDDEHFEIMTNETNRYARDYLSGRQLSRKSRFHGWKVGTTKAEMKVFISLIIAMGLVKQMDLNEYWTTDEITRTPFFPKTLVRDIFWLLLSFFHLVDNSRLAARGTPTYSTINKLGSIYRNIIGRFTSMYTPSKHIALDEGMVPWRGNLHFRTYNPDKPKRYGMKAYMLCDSENGYICKFKLYTGKSMVQPSALGITYDLVMDMTKDYQLKGYHLFMDNYYSSPTLYPNLYERGIQATGTLRANRKGVPDKIKKQVVAKGEPFSMHNEKLLLVKFHDRNIVYLLSTVENAGKVNTGRVRRGTQEQVRKPKIAHEYDKYMGGVDKADQMLSYNLFTSRTLKWWKRLFFHVLNMAMLNAYLLYKHTTNKKILPRKFRAHVIKGLLKTVKAEEVPGQRNLNLAEGRRSNHTEPMNRLCIEFEHWPVEIVALAGNRKENVTRACVVCSKVERQAYKAADHPPGPKRRQFGRKSTYKCEGCNSALCIVPCFKLYNTEEDFVKAYLDLKAEKDIDD